jgi:hypothetical protein
MTTTSKRWPLQAASQSFCLLLLAVAAAASSHPPPEASCAAARRLSAPPPFVTIPDPWLPASIRVADLPVQNVTSYLLPMLSHEGRGEDKLEGSAAADEDDGRPVIFHPVVIGQMPLFDADHARAVVAEARQAWHDGVWTNQFTLAQRIAAIRRFLDEAFSRDSPSSLRDELAHVCSGKLARTLTTHIMK